jgi:transposase
LSLAAVLEGMERGEAARIGGMDRQTLRDWVHRFNERGLEGLLDHWTSGPKSRLSLDQLAQLAAIVETGPEVKTDGVVRWRRVDLKRVISSRFGVDYHERSVGKLLRKLGFSHVSARPRHPKQDERIVESFKNVWPAPSARGLIESADLISLLQRIRLRSRPPSQDGDTRVPVLIKLPASSAVF